MPRAPQSPENIHHSSKEEVNLANFLIAQRNLFASMEKQFLEMISQNLTSLPTLRLDRKRINCIPHLQGLEEIHSIYLQQNQIEKIENLSCFPNLKSPVSSLLLLYDRFLCLAGNRISRVENLQALLKLQSLDLSYNCIESLDTDELPQSILILNLTGNKCTNQKGYRESILAALPRLIQLDTQIVPERTAHAQDWEEAERSSEDSDEDIPELSQPLSAEKVDFFVDLHDEFTSRSERRRREAHSEHEAHLQELKEWQNLRNLLPNPGPQTPGLPDLKIPSLGAPAFQTECHGSPTPSLKTASSMFHEELSTPKEKAEVRSQIQEKTLKGEVSGTTKCVRKSKK